MPIFRSLFSGKGDFVAELVKIGNNEGFLSTKVGGSFDEEYHHKRAREIGLAAYEKGGLRLMRSVHAGVRTRLGNVQARDLEHCWNGIGGWLD